MGIHEIPRDSMTQQPPHYVLHSASRRFQMSPVESWSRQITWFSLKWLSTMSIPTFWLWFMFFFDVLFFFMAGLYDVIVGWLLRRCPMMVLKPGQYRIQYRLNTRRHGRPPLIWVCFRGRYIWTSLYCWYWYGQLWIRHGEFMTYDPIQIIFNHLLRTPSVCIHGLFCADFGFRWECFSVGQSWPNLYYVTLPNPRSRRNIYPYILSWGRNWGLRQTFRTFCQYLHNTSLPT